MINRGRANNSMSPETMQLALDNRNDRLSLGQIHGHSSTAKNQLEAGFLQAAHAQIAQNNI